MVRSRPVLIFVALGAALLATAAPLRLAASIEPASQEAASLCARFDQDKAGSESGNPHDCGRSELDVSSSKDYVLDMGSFSSSRDSSVIVPLPPFDSPSSQEHVDPDTASAPRIESPAFHPSGPFVSPSSQECADVDDNSALSIKSPAPHSSGPFDSPSSQEHVDAITADVPGIESPALHPSGPLYLPSIRECADADDSTASVPGIASRAPHPSGLLELFCRSLGVLSSRSSNAPLARSLLRKRTDTEIASADDPDSLATLHISVPLQPTSTFSTSFPSVAASSDQHQDAREEEDSVLATHSIASHGPDSSVSLHPSAVSVAHTLAQEHTNTDFTSTHVLESRSPKPPGPLVVTSDIDTYQFVSRLDKATFVEAVRNHIKSKCKSYDQDMKSTSWEQLGKTNSGQSLLEIHRLLPGLHPDFDPDLVTIGISAGIIATHLRHSDHGFSQFELRAYTELKNWNSLQFQTDVDASKDWDDFKTKYTGRLWLRIYDLLPSAEKNHFHLEVFQNMVFDPLETSAGIIAARLSHSDHGTYYWHRLPLHAYTELKNWNSLQFQTDVDASKDWDDFETKYTGRLWLRIYDLLPSERKSYLQSKLKHLRYYVTEDIEGLSVEEKADARMKLIFTSKGDDVEASLRNSRGSLPRFKSKNTPCFKRYESVLSWAPVEVKAVIVNKMKEKLQPYTISRGTA
ncbi:hypothetical protein F5878DRAFT_709200 [Lentinula raphanica]|uniref:Uncharacterized protein n=1 Tax=Lentinula raphanica TaxID=153919 RepID=A0AA38PBX6_9AGAR|nr:hypothetical protein F5880DRAFT_1546015 [Lentinula raphanica]KAJ3839833.1 hypothetical protein F5878DRAFT_709200 [Lentinula raphanica]